MLVRRAFACLLGMLGCSCGDRVPDPDPSWTPPDWVGRVFYPLEGQVVIHWPTLSTEWVFYYVGLPHSSGGVVSSYAAHFWRTRRGVPGEYRIVLFPRSLGDLGDLFYRITGLRNSRFAGDTTAYYMQGIQEQEEFARDVEELERH